MMAGQIGAAALVYWYRSASVNKSIRKSHVATVAVRSRAYTAL